MTTWPYLLLFVCGFALGCYALFRFTKHYAYQQGFRDGNQAGLRASRELSRIQGQMEGFSAGYQQGRSEKIQKDENAALLDFTRRLN